MPINKCERPGWGEWATSDPQIHYTNFVCPVTGLSWLWQGSVSGSVNCYRYLGPGIPPEVLWEGWRFSEFPSHFLSFQTAGLPRSVGQGLEFRKARHLRTFPDICLNQDLPDFGIFRMRPNHAARTTTRVAPYVTPLSRCQGNHKGCPYGITWLTRSEGHFGHLGRRTEWPWRRVRRDVVLHRYYGRGLLSEMGRGKLSVV